MRVTKELFGRLNENGVYAYTLENKHGVKITAIDYGCTITKIYTPNRDGEIENIVLGYDTLEEYLNGTSYFGCVVGRIAGRIAGGEFMLEGTEYKLAQNENPNHLHGGIVGFDKRVWNATVEEEENQASIVFSYFSPDGEENYPGNVEMQVTYTLNNDNQFTIHYEGTPDRTTILNVTNHTYFNLSGDLKTDVKDHYLTMKSDQFLELGDDLIPTGTFLDVKDTAFDFHSTRQIRTGIESKHPQNILAGHGYDHPFVLSDNNNQEIQLEDRENGRVLTVETDQPAVVVYSASQLAETGEIYGVASKKYLGICLETQGLPNAINEVNFPSWVVEKGKTYSTSTTFTFGTT